MTKSVEILDSSLRQDFGFQHIFWVFSGRRGVHCWVNDELARQLPNDARGALVDFLSVHIGSDNATEKTNLRFPLHPSLRRAYDMMLPDFVSDILSERGQGWFETIDGCRKLLSKCPSEDIKGTLLRRWAAPGNMSTAEEKWQELCSQISARRQGASGAKRAKNAADYMALEEWKVKLVFEFCYPRLDANVSKQQNHLLKSPWSIHPKTGRVCVPFLASAARELDIFSVPTLRTLMEEIDSFDGAADTPDLEKTSMLQYVELWRRSFLDGLYNDIRRKNRERVEKETVEW